MPTMTPNTISSFFSPCASLNTIHKSTDIMGIIINNKYFNNDMQNIQFSKYETLFNKWKDKMIKEQKRQRRYKNI